MKLFKFFSFLMTAILVIYIVNVAHIALVCFFFKELANIPIFNFFLSAQCVALFIIVLALAIPSWRRAWCHFFVKEQLKQYSKE